MRRIVSEWKPSLDDRLGVEMNKVKSVILSTSDGSTIWEDYNLNVPGNVFDRYEYTVAIEPWFRVVNRVRFTFRVYFRWE
jgi:hypothetical protein